MARSVRSILSDYEQDDEITGAILAYGLNPKELVRRGFAYLDRNNNVFRFGKDPNERTSTGRINS